MLRTLRVTNGKLRRSKHVSLSGQLNDTQYRSYLSNKADKEKFAKTATAVLKVGLGDEIGKEQNTLSGLKHAGEDVQKKGPGAPKGRNRQPGTAKRNIKSSTSDDLSAIRVWQNLPSDNPEILKGSRRQRERKPTAEYVELDQRIARKYQESVKWNHIETIQNSKSVGRKRLLGSPSDVESSQEINSGVEDAIDTVGMGEVWSQWKHKRVRASPYLSKGTDKKDLNPIAKTLFESYRSCPPGVELKRVSVVSRNLCDDIIDRMKPTLMKHVGCDIIDINPGPGIWSTAIHDVLKPRTHVLMEPESPYQPFVQRLADADPSYKLFPKFGLAWNHFQRVTSPEFLPHQVELEKDDPRRNQPNDTLLLMANVAYNPRKHYQKFNSIAQLLIHQLLDATHNNTLCHKYGLVRMLIWVSDEERHVLLPRNITNRVRSVIETEFTCEHIEEIASTANIYEHGLRDHFIKLQSSIDTRQRMKAAGLSTPPSRASPLELEAASGAVVPADRDSISVIRGTDVSRADLEERWAAGAFPKMLENPIQMTKGCNLTPEYYRLRVLERRSRRTAVFKNSNQRPENEGWEDELKGLRQKFINEEFQQYTVPKDKIVDGLAALRNIYTSDYLLLKRQRTRTRVDTRRDMKFHKHMVAFDKVLELQRLARQSDATEEMKREAVAHTEEWKAVSAKIPREQYYSYLLHHDNRAAFQSKPPILFWDRRRAEPLMVKPQEFFPQHELALLDYQPKGFVPELRKEMPDAWRVFEHIIGVMLQRPTRPLKIALDDVAPGAHDWMIAHCPSLTDPDKGGNMDAECLNPRVLTQEMYQEILEAWHHWPYKLSEYELVKIRGYEEHSKDVLPQILKHASLMDDDSSNKLIFPPGLQELSV
ncbi:hypothetical protein BJ878DRAFT_520763 [Calycina marina]|uniref:Mitochondrial transcription factor 1 n=1 Tax=Calycina marina TaxID=1763456 RepID=A0A9P7YXA5_9HELO|nr:hypothetical protein BJ878DRAFT_520763 [Calycina marina]